MLALLPVCAAIFGFIFLNQSPSLLDLLGMALVLIGVAVQERDETDRHHEVVETT
jgi:inner membrane transporter RhtA